MSHNNFRQNKRGKKGENDLVLKIYINRMVNTGY
jgi:hypothetical protein